MNKTAIKNYAIRARVQLIESAKQRAYEYEITEDGENNSNLDSVGGRLLSSVEKEQRKELISQINSKGYAQVMEEAAYTWFNRFIALRFMEVNGYLPSKVRVFTDENNTFRPEILREAMNVELDGIDKAKVLDLLDKQNNEELYKYLLITQCNALNAGLPYMFERIANWTELLFPSNLLRPDSVLAQMISEIPEEDFETIEIIGWLYQFYFSEKHDSVINILKGTVKKEDIPAATALFTTDWVVKYIVDNSLGRYWIERNPGSRLAENLEFFVTPKDGVIPQVDEKINPEEIKFLDPCMGSGHFLVYAFDVLMLIYAERGWTERDAAKSIIENNLFGLDIDDRSAQLAYFAVMMKARQFNRRIITSGAEPHIMSVAESNGISEELVERYNKDGLLRKIVDTFRDAKETGSIIPVSLTEDELDRIQALLAEIDDMSSYGSIQSMVDSEEIMASVWPLLEQARIMTQKYDIVDTNPPYLNKFDPVLKDFVNKNYKEYGGDLFSVFIYRNFFFCKENGYTGFMTPFVWMFIKTYENLRRYKNGRETEKGLYFRLSDFRGGMEVQRVKTLEAIADKNCGYFYETSADNFSKIPGSPLAYWVGENFVMLFSKTRLNKFAEPKSGIMTGNNDEFMRTWFEVGRDKINFNCAIVQETVNTHIKWYPYNKGGDFRKWYGNLWYVVNMQNRGFDIANSGKNNNYRLRDQSFYFKHGITWTALTTGKFNARFCNDGMLCDSKGPLCYIFNDDNIDYILSYINSAVANEVFKFTAPTLDYNLVSLGSLPITIEKDIKQVVDCKAKANIFLSKTDWDSYETSWDFGKHPLV